MDRLKEKMGIKGFTVQSSQCPLNIPGDQAVMVLDHSLSNVDNCYDNNTGVFTAQKTGVYSFYINGLLDSDDYEGHTDLVLEKTTGEPIQKVFFRGRGDIFVGSQGSFDVKVKLDRGEQVRVRHEKGDLGLKGKRQTRFSGVFEFEYPDAVDTRSK